MTWDEVGYVISSEYRKKVMAEVAGGPKTPSSISKATDIEIPHVSRSLTQLREKELIELLNPNAEKGRLYALTDQGEEVWGAVKEQSLAQ